MRISLRIAVLLLTICVVAALAAGVVWSVDTLLPSSKSHGSRLDDELQEINVRHRRTWDEERHSYPEGPEREAAWAKEIERRQAEVDAAYARHGCTPQTRRVP